MMRVRFSDVDEYLEELRKDAPLVDRKILRLTNSFQARSFSPHIHTLTVMATARVNDSVVVLEASCGDLWGQSVPDEETLGRADAIHSRIKQTAADLELEVRAGLLVSADA